MMYLFQFYILMINLIISLPLALNTQFLKPCS